MIVHQPRIKVSLDTTNSFKVSFELRGSPSMLYTRLQALYLCLSDSKPLGYLRLYKTSNELLRAYEALHHLRVQCPSKSALIDVDITYPVYSFCSKMNSQLAKRPCRNSDVDDDYNHLLSRSFERSDDPSQDCTSPRTFGSSRHVIIGIGLSYCGFLSN